MEAAALGSRFLLAFVLILASIPKLAAQQEFARAVENYGLVPRFLVRPFSRTLPAFELLAGSALLAGVAIAAVSVAVTGMLLIFATAITWNLLHGRKIECGCAGSALPRVISWHLVARDLFLAAVAVFVALAAFAGIAGSFLSPPEGVAAGDAVAVLLIAALLVFSDALIADGFRAASASHAFSNRTGST
ncbi:MAG TPA: MauE/DoxX family redox-associated membrane protein [Gaiellaceae bacterium]|nr:MauE/DoxX family redox-associated membrane protein [Gaiellaceae bacterium]